MKTIVFDGKAFARKIEDELYHKIEKLARRPVMATIIVGDDPASRLYVRLKKEAASRIGAQMDVYEYPENITKEDLIARMNRLNKDETLSGMMIQLPLPAHLKNDTMDIINHIPKHRDVDGLREDSPFMSATVCAVISILDVAKKKLGIAPDAYVAVVGAKGEVGRKLVEVLSRSDFEVGGLTRDMDKDMFKKETLSAKVIISATGQPGIIGGEHVAKGAVVIDVGSPKGDINYEEVRSKASFITPVPGGVGPVTIACLLKNLVGASHD